MTRFFSSSVIFLLIVFLHTTVWAKTDTPPPIQLNQPTQLIGPYVEVFNDHNRNMTLADIRQLPDNEWKVNDSPIVNQGMMYANVWLHFRISKREQNNAENERFNWQMLLEYPIFTQVSLYYRDEFRQWRVKESGNNIPMQLREIQDQQIIFNLNTNPNQINEYYLQVRATGPSHLPLQIVREDVRKANSVNRSNQLHFYYGLMTVMLLFNLFIAGGTRSPIYFLYSCYICSILLFNLANDGFLNERLWPKHTITTQYFVNTLVFTTIISASLFSRSFLKTKDRHPILDNSIKTIIAAAIIGLLLIPLSDFHITAIASIVLTALGSTLIFVTAFITYLDSHSDARFFTMAWGLFLLSALLSSASYSGYMPWNDLTLYYIHIGSAIEVILLSFALAERINRYRSEKLEAEQMSNAKLEDANKQLIESNQLKDQFLATISHELRTPMNGVIGPLDLIQTDRLDKELSDQLLSVERSAKDMMRLIEDLLCFSELQSESPKVGQEVFSIYHIFKEMHDVFYTKAKNKKLKFRIQSTKQTDHWLQGDRDKLRIILFQLIDNAIKFTESGSVDVEINSSPTAGDTINLEFYIRDTGIGMDEDTLRMVYSAFRQADSTYSRRYGGLGIGLAISKKVIEILHGDIRIKSTPKMGTEVQLLIPLKKAASKENEASREEEKESQHDPIPLLALVVEDNIVNQKVLAGFLRKLGVQTVLATNGAEAVRRCEEQIFDIIFMDCQMPVMDGFEATKRIRTPSNSNYKTPIVAVTANAMDADRQNCLDIGMDHYLKKPITLKDIRNTCKHFAALKNNPNQQEGGFV